MEDEEYKVSSELYEEQNYITKDLKPTYNEKNVVSEFTFTCPKGAQKDADGDLIVSRKKDTEAQYVIEIEHSTSTVLNLVGLQIWRGALLLADWLIYNNKLLPEDSMVLELGSGVGLTSIVAAMYRPVVITDVNKGGLLELIKHNVARNKKLVKKPSQVLELDFFAEKLNPDIEKLLPKIEVILAADVVYDDNLTEAFVNTVNRLLSYDPKKTVYVALEKRYVFTVADCDTAAPCYEFFLESLEKCKNLKTEKLELDFPKYFKYDRVKELVLWKITCKQ